MTPPTVRYVCQSCDRVEDTPHPQCPVYGGPFQKHVSVHLGVVATAKTGLQVVADNLHGEEQVIHYVSPAGTTSHSTLSPTQLDLTLRGPLDIGQAGEPSVAQRVIGQLRTEGKEVLVLTHRDQSGEDHKISCDGEEVVIQVVAVPAAAHFMAEASQGSASTSVPIAAAATWAYEAVSKKADRYAPADRAGMLLALDARAIGVLASPSVAVSIEEQYGDLCRTSGFGSIWIVGPSDSRCTRVGSCRW